MQEIGRPLVLDVLTRVSRTMGREGDSYGSPEIQLRDCRNWIALHGHIEGESYHEENVSGGALLAKRPGLNAVIERMRAGLSDGVVVRAYDRFMRSVSLSWEVIELIEGKDGRTGIGRLFAAQGNVDFRTPTGRLLFTQLQSLAQYQRENARHEWAVARTRAWERGVWLARAPFGYIKLPAELKTLAERGALGGDGPVFDLAELEQSVVGGIVKDPTTAPLALEAFERREDDASLTDVARWLAEETGRPWSPTVVSKMLGNVAYLGQSVVHRCDRDEETGRVVAREPLMSREEDHAALVDIDLFNAVQGKRGPHRPKTKDATLWFLTGLVRCAGCRYMLRPDTNNNGFRSYTCRGHHGMGECDARTHIGAEMLERYVLQAMLSIDDVTIREVECQVATEALRAAVAEAREEVKRLVAALRRTRYPDLIEAELADAEDQLARTERELAAAEAKLGRSSNGARNLDDILESGTNAERRGVIESYLDRIVVRRDAGAPLRDRVLLLLKGEEKAYEPLPGPGKRIELLPWPWPSRNHDQAVPVAVAA